VYSFQTATFPSLDEGEGPMKQFMLDVLAMVIAGVTVAMVVQLLIIS
jgi:hypothetical protein